MMLQMYPHGAKRPEAKGMGGGGSRAGRLFRELGVFRWDGEEVALMQQEAECFLGSLPIC